MIENNGASTASNSSNTKKRERAQQHDAPTRVFVYNLTWDTRWQDVKDYFSRAGQVAFADVLREGGPEGRSKGCAVVEFESSADAANAIETLNGTELNGRVIYCREDFADARSRPLGRIGANGNKRWRPSGPLGYQWFGEYPPWGNARFPPDAPGPSFDAFGGVGPFFEGGVEFGGCDFMHGSYGHGGYGPPGPATVGHKVFVSNLSFDSTWQDLKDHFKAAGNVVYVFIKTDDRGKSKGCGTVQFETPAEALRAISLLSNSTLGGRQIVVREDRSEWNQIAAGQAGPTPCEGFPHQRGVPKERETAVVVYGLPFSYESVHLTDFMRSAGPIVKADVGKGPDGNSRGFGTVLFQSAEAAHRAVRMFDGQELHGRIVKVQIDKFG